MLFAQPQRRAVPLNQAAVSEARLITIREASQTGFNRTWKFDLPGDTGKVLFIVDRQIRIALHTVQLVAQHRVATLWRLHPGSTDQRWIMAHMLVVAAV